MGDLLITKSITKVASNWSWQTEDLILPLIEANGMQIKIEIFN